MPRTEEYRDVHSALVDAAAYARYEVVGTSSEREVYPESATVSEIAQADAIIADVSIKDSRVFFELGIAHAMGHTIIAVSQSTRPEIPIEMVRSVVWINYSLPSLKQFSRHVAYSLDQLRTKPRRSRNPIPGTQPALPYVIDWDRLDPADVDNLIRELLMQMGFANVDWISDDSGFDLSANLSRADPDGFDFKEPWFVWLGYRHPSTEVPTTRGELLSRFERLLRRSLSARRSSAGTGDSRRITFLFIFIDDERRQSKAMQQLREMDANLWVESFPIRTSDLPGFHVPI